MSLTARIAEEASNTLHDVAPIAVILAAFQLAVARRYPPRLKSILTGMVYLIVGLTLFRVGLAESLIPLGETMARQLIQPAVAQTAAGWWDHLPLYAFAALIGFAATLIEPTLIAVADRVRDLTGGALQPWALRLVIAVGVAAGLLLGTARIVLGIPLEYVIAILVGGITLLASAAPRAIVPLALDSGGMATSVVTVPMIAAFALAVADALPGRSSLTDGFGIIMLALLLPAATLLAFANLQAMRRKRPRPGD